ncbi:hypothetical protein [Methylacidimicrobium sp. B4]|uniref:hypothetical protein n=1 Tax=Methylacidimicrobium sp. B4 TaxID=2796139 RepID=UPI001A90AFED|nr:hypothetical protein [Methylacidimicrobium sp. B4]QSR85682.1 hypothetical protein MacB4_05560 [Methylacidimicrobium sp. B4]
MKLRCTVDPVEALRRGIDAPESTVLELNPAVLSPAEREWLAGALQKGEGASPDAPALLTFPYPIPAPSVEGLREAIASRLSSHAPSPEHGLTTRFDEPRQPGAHPAAPPPPAPTGNPVGEVAKAAGFMGLGALMGGMIDRVFGPHPQPVDVIVEPEQLREGSWGEGRPQQPPAESSAPSSCCDDRDGGDDSSADPSADLASDDSSDFDDSGGDYDLV